MRGLDTGDVLLRRTLPIGETETTAELHDRLSALGLDAIVTALATLSDLTPEPQPDDGVTYAEKIAKSEAKIDWDCACGRGRPQDPWPVAISRRVDRNRRAAHQAAGLASGRRAGARRHLA